MCKWETMYLFHNSEMLKNFINVPILHFEISICDHILNVLQLSLTVDGKSYIFNIPNSTDDVDHIISHIGVSLKQAFPAFPLE